MAHLTTPEAEALLDQEISVLDKGYVRLIDYLGNDQRIVQAARVSYGAGTKSVRTDEKLIRYLLRNRHTSPFEQVVLTFHAKMPIFVARQWVRHRTARLNEKSGRYSEMSDEFYLPEIEQLRRQSDSNKQARSDESLEESIAQQMIDEMLSDQAALFSHYKGLLDQGLAREVARINLPLSLYTEWYWQIDLHNLFHFLQLRLDSHAQYEIRVYAEAMARCAQAVAPIAYEAFEEYVLEAVTFSRTERQKLKAILKGDPVTLTGKGAEAFYRKL